MLFVDNRTRTNRGVDCWACCLLRRSFCTLLPDQGYSAVFGYYKKITGTVCGVERGEGGEDPKCSLQFVQESLVGFIHRRRFLRGCLAGRVTAGGFLYDCTV